MKSKEKYFEIPRAIISVIFVFPYTFLKEVQPQFKESEVYVEYSSITTGRNVTPISATVLNSVRTAVFITRYPCHFFAMNFFQTYKRLIAGKYQYKKEFLPIIYIIN